MVRWLIINVIMIALSAFFDASEVIADGRNEKIINPNPDRTWSKAAGGFFSRGKSIAVVVGISNYKNGYNPLNSAASDAKKMEDFLVKDAGFDVVYVLTNDEVSHSAIDRLMTDEIPQIVGQYDRFLFYWSGHGDQMISADGRRSFGFLPLANSKPREFSTMVSMEDLSRWDSYLSAQQALFILDSCLSGLAGVQSKDLKSDRLEQLSQPTHQLLTAGTKGERVISGDRWTGSLFTDSLIDGARGNAHQSFGVVSIHSLLDYVQERVAVERREVNWEGSLTPQIHDLQAGTGAFFFTNTRIWTNTYPAFHSPSEKTENKGEDQGFKSLSLSEEAALKKKDQFKECDSCPEMVVVPSGEFLMGAPVGEEYLTGGMDGPIHKVKISSAFAVGKYDVTVGQFSTFVDETGYASLVDDCMTLKDNPKKVKTSGLTWRNPGFSQGALDPVVCVNWNDANAYAKWLTRKTGKSYRLLSEAEWEYSARSGTESWYYFGDDIRTLCQATNFADYRKKKTHTLPDAMFDSRIDSACDGGVEHTANVGSYPPNLFGLYDMSGNAWQWVEDCFNPSYSVDNTSGGKETAPSDGTPWLVGDCTLRIQRGGSWTDGPRQLRSGARSAEHLETGYYGSGFRVARDLYVPPVAHNANKADSR
jgi:formylglycine-generating enzyme required for sulfatase activity